jgi:hypothetical protein
MYILLMKENNKFDNHEFSKELYSQGTDSALLFMWEQPTLHPVYGLSLHSSSSITALPPTVFEKQDLCHNLVSLVLSTEINCTTIS